MTPRICLSLSLISLALVSLMPVVEALCSYHYREWPDYIRSTTNSGVGLY